MQQPPLKRFRLIDLESAATLRLPGYVEAVKSIAQRDGEWLTLTPAQYQDIRSRFWPPGLPQDLTGGGCCGG